MENLGKKVGYLKGLMEGVDFSDDPSRGKLLTAMAELLGDLVDRVESVEELMDDLNDYVESIDDDLSALEGDCDDFHSIDDDEYEDDFSDEDYGEPTEGAEENLHLLNSKLFNATPILTGSICSACGKMFFVNQSDPEDAQYDCPHCGARVSACPLTPDNTPIAQRVED